MDEDCKLIDSLNRGSYKDFTILYNKYVGLLYSFVFSLIRNKTVTEDVVQETFAKVWINRIEIDHTKVFRNYIFTIARNLLLNELRNKVNNNISLETINVVDSIEELSEKDYITRYIIENNDFVDFQIKKIKAAKKMLPSRQLQLFEMNKEQGLSIEEIIAKTGLSEQSIRNQIHLAVKKIREYLSSLFLSF